MNKKRRGAEADRKFTEAQQERQIAKELEEKGEHGPYDHGTFHYRQAERLEGEAKELLKPAGEIVRGGGEAMDLGASDLNWNLVETLQNPDSVSLGASEDRMKLLVDADVRTTGGNTLFGGTVAISGQSPLCMGSFHVFGYHPSPIVVRVKIG